MMMAVAVAVPRTVTLSHACAHSSVVVRALGEQIGEEMRVAGSVKQDYFMVRFQDVPAQEAIDKIAETLNATWVRRDGVLTLTRTDEQDREDFEQEQALVVQGFQKALDDNRLRGPYGVVEAAEGLERLIPLSGDQGDSNYLSVRTLRKQSPIWRLLVRVAEEVGAEGLAEMSLYESVQYAVSPGPRQRSLAGSRALELYKEETKAHMTAIRSTDVLRRLKGPRWDSVLVGAYRDGPPDPAGITITMVRGEQWVTITTNLSDRAILNLRLLGPNGEGLPEELAASSEVIEPSDLVANITTNLRSLHSRDERYRREPLKYREFASDPMEHELIGLYTSEWILDDAARKGLNVVGLLSDGLFYGCLLMNFNGATSGEMWSNYCSSGSTHTAAVDGKWLKVVPRRRASARANRVDRGLVKQFIDQYEREGMLTIDSSLKWMLESADQRLLRIYHELSDDEKKLAYDGGLSLAYPTGRSELDTEIKRAVRRGRRNLTSEPVPNPWDRGSLPQRISSTAAVTALLASEIPEGSTVRLAVDSRELVYARITYRPAASGYVPEALGRLMGEAEYTDFYFPSQFKEFFMSEAELLVVEMEIPDPGFITGSVQVDRPTDRSRYVPFSMLPQNVQDSATSSKTEYLSLARANEPGHWAGQLGEKYEEDGPLMRSRVNVLGGLMIGLAFLLLGLMFNTRLCYKRLTVGRGASPIPIPIGLSIFGFMWGGMAPTLIFGATGDGAAMMFETVLFCLLGAAIDVCVTMFGSHWLAGKLHKWWSGPSPV